MGENRDIKKGLTIGKLIKQLKKSYPGIRSSKLRFLESQGLINPKRGINKYRSYTEDDIKRINFILKLQKDFYLPLDVIKEKLGSKEFRDYSEKGTSLKNMQLEFESEFDVEKSKKYFTVEELRKKLKLQQSFIEDIIEHDLVDSKNNNGELLINSDDVRIVEMAKELLKYGIQVKHLKMFENFAVRHSSFIQQIIMPLMISSNKDLHKKGRKVAIKLESYLCDLHELLLKKENRKFMEKE
jgi:DNA-binding transcriptional MerR regulator